LVAKVRAIVIGGVTSGVGKTTIATGIMGALSRRQLKVQPFKTGPDYIDTTYHTWVTGSASRNLDTWMLTPGAVLELFGKAMAGKDIAVVEGVMGLFDGHSSTSDEASTSQLAKLLRAPVILVVDSRNGARSLAAIVKGYQTFDPELRIGAVVLNGIGSERHYEICREAIEHYTGASVLGYLPRRQDLTLPERHLGLIPTVEGPASEEFRHALIHQCESTLDLAAILRLSEQASPPSAPPGLFPAEPLPRVTRIAVARDKAFSFYYQDSLDLLEAWGAELVPFSPMEDSGLPAGVGGAYLGGGFPEMYAETLARNESMKRSLLDASNTGMPVYAECGGLMYLGSAIRDLEGKEYPMAGVIPVTSRIDTPKLSLGYRTIRARSDGPLLKKGETTRGHEFHWSKIETAGKLAVAYSVAETGQGEGFQRRNVLASYVHLHMGSLASMAPRFVETCRAFSEHGRIVK
jgi:cobyrinic acid a,c-diamide synthase